MKVEVLPKSKTVKISLQDSERVTVRAHTKNEMIFYLSMEEARQLINKMWEVIDEHRHGAK